MSEHLAEDAPKELDLSPDCVYFHDLFVKCVEICKFIAGNVGSDHSVKLIAVIDAVGASGVSKSERRYVLMLKSFGGVFLEVSRCQSEYVNVQGSVTIKGKRPI